MPIDFLLSWAVITSLSVSIVFGLFVEHPEAFGFIGVIFGKVRDLIIEFIEWLFFGSDPFYIAYIQSYGFIGTIARLNSIYRWKK